MSRTKSYQTGVMKIFDKIMFNHICVHICLTEEEKNYLGELQEAVRLRISKEGITGDNSAIAEHIIYSLIEINTSSKLKEQQEWISSKIDMPDNNELEKMEVLNEHIKSFFMAYIVAIEEKLNGVDCDKILEIVDDVCDRFKSGPAVSRHRLTEKMLAFQYYESPADLLIWAAKNELISCSKINRNAKTVSDQYVHRLLKLCEFEMTRHKVQSMSSKISMARTIMDHARKIVPSEGVSIVREAINIEDGYKYEKEWVWIKKYDPNRINDKMYLQKFFGDIGERLVHFSLFKGSAGKNTSILAAAMVEKIHIENNHVAIYCETNNRDTLTYSISERLMERGLTIKPRTIYETHRNLSKIELRKINTYCDLMRMQKSTGCPIYGDNNYSTIILSCYNI